MNLGQWLPGAISAFIAVVGIIIAKRWDRGSQREMYPAQIIEELRKDLLRLDVRLEAAENRERMLTDYVHVLRGDLSDKGFTPPPWPDGLSK